MIFKNDYNKTYLSVLGTDAIVNGDNRSVRDTMIRLSLQYHTIGNIVININNIKHNSHDYFDFFFMNDKNFPKPFEFYSYVDSCINIYKANVPYLLDVYDLSSITYNWKERIKKGKKILTVYKTINTLGGCEYGKNYGACLLIYTLDQLKKILEYDVINCELILIDFNLFDLCGYEINYDKVLKVNGSVVLKINHPDKFPILKKFKIRNPDYEMYHKYHNNIYGVKIFPNETYDFNFYRHIIPFYMNYKKTYGINDYIRLYNMSETGMYHETLEYTIFNLHKLQYIKLYGVGGYVRTAPNEINYDFESFKNMTKKDSTLIPDYVLDNLVSYFKGTEYESTVDAFSLYTERNIEKFNKFKTYILNL